MERLLRWIATVVSLLVALQTGVRAHAALPTIGGRIEGSGIVRFDQSSPRQRPLARIDLFAEQKVTSELRWKLATTGRWGGTIENASGAGLIDFGHSFQNIDPSLQLDEAWLEWVDDDFDVRAGNQRFTWGKLDGPKPNDLLNPLRYYDPLVDREKDQKIAVPALSGSYYFPSSWRDRLPDDARVTLVWEPIAVPWLFPEADERWFPPAAETGPPLQIGSLTVNDREICPCVVDIDQEIRNSSAPARRFDNGNVALRVAGRSGGVDWSAMFFDGYDPAANFSVPVRLDLSNAGAIPGVLSATALTQLRPAYRRFQSIGADASSAFGGFTTRFEAAWRFRRPYPREVSSLTGEIVGDEQRVAALLDGKTVTLNAFEPRDAAEWGIGADYLIDGWLPLLELYQIILLHNDTPLLIRNVDTRITASLRKTWLEAESLETKIVGLWGIESGYEMVRAEATYAITDAIAAQLGVLGVWGDARSLIGEFNRNSELFGRLSYSF
ncbi:hypothetical protein K2Z84_11625 [Candidatus Binatia bacterium]|jgi:hypothetical protein|nr:hypothetical protein [Candidatus Binatia bacterium]